MVSYTYIVVLYMCSMEKQQPGTNKWSLNVGYIRWELFIIVYEVDFWLILL